MASNSNVNYKIWNKCSGKRDSIFGRVDQCDATDKSNIGKK